MQAEWTWLRRLYRPAATRPQCGWGGWTKKVPYWLIALIFPPKQKQRNSMSCHGPPGHHQVLQLILQRCDGRQTMTAIVIAGRACLTTAMGCHSRATKFIGRVSE